MSLNTNGKAPSIDAIDIFGRKVSLDTLPFQKFFIGFYRHAGCPFCNLRIHELLELHQIFSSNNVGVIWFFESSETLLHKSIFKEQLNDIYIVSDSNKIWYSTYQVEQSIKKSAKSHFLHFFGAISNAQKKSVPIFLMKEGESFSTMSAEFLIDKKGNFKHIHYSDDHVDFIEIQQVVDFAVSIPEL